MKILHTRDEVRTWTKNIQAQGGTICLVPTMGFFHAGHLALMERAGEIADFVLVTLFVNPTQFAPGEDLAAYPHDFDADCQQAEAVGVHGLFCPTVAEMYPDEGKTAVEVYDLSHQLCGSSRPTHFKGVATVVAKLFNICSTDAAIFGEKDFQQLAIIRRMVKDLNFPVQIHSLPIVRETDGLAMSSRNTYLAKEERGQALCLFRGLLLGRELAVKHVACEAIIKKITTLVLQEGSAVIDYIAIINKDTLENSRHVDEHSVLAMAVKIGKTRLIDNGFLLIH